MKKLSPAIILVDYIQVDKPHLQFNTQAIEEAAQLIVQTNGVITPIIVSRVGTEHYHLVHGYFEYYAALRAKEIDSMVGESIDAYIIEDNNKTLIEKQIEVFKKREHFAREADINHVQAQDIASMKQQLNTLSQDMAELKAFVMNAGVSFTASSAADAAETSPSLPEKSLPSEPQFSPSDSVPLASTPEPAQPPVSVQTEARPEQADTTTSSTMPEYLQVLNQLDTEKLQVQIKAIDINSSISKKVIDNRPFYDESNLTAVKGIADKTVDKLKTLSFSLLKPDTPNKTKKHHAQASPDANQTDATAVVSNKQASEFLIRFNQMEEKDLFFKVKRILKLKADKLNKLLSGRPYASEEAIKLLNKKQLENLKKAL